MDKLNSKNAKTGLLDVPGLHQNSVYSVYSVPNPLDTTNSESKLKSKPNEESKPDDVVCSAVYFDGLPISDDKSDGYDINSQSKPSKPLNAHPATENVVEWFAVSNGAYATRAQLKKAVDLNDKDIEVLITQEVIKAWDNPDYVSLVT